MGNKGYSVSNDEASYVVRGDITGNNEAEIDRRSFSVAAISTRSDDNRMVVEGLVAPYNTPAWADGMPEVIMPGAFEPMLTGIAQGKHHVHAIRNHSQEHKADYDKLLATTKNKSLIFNDTEEGLRATMIFPDVDYARATYRMIKGGYLDSASFGFIMDLTERQYRNGVREIHS